MRPAKRLGASSTPTFKLALGGAESPVGREGDTVGQGLYDMLGYGVLDPPVQVDGDNYVIELDEMFPLLCQGQVDATYETEPPCLTIPLAISDPWLQEYYHLPPLPNWVPRVAPRRARPIEAPPDFEVPRDVQERWRAVHAIYARAGMVLPDAQLILINDWD